MGDSREWGTVGSVGRWGVGDGREWGTGVCDGGECGTVGRV